MRHHDYRHRHIERTGLISFFLNLFLFFIKLYSSVLIQSTSILNDAFNNLGDGVSSLIYFVGFKLSSKQPDKNHPLGHGRGEYLTSFIMGVFVIVLSLQLLISNVMNFSSPSSQTFTSLIYGILMFSILIKIGISIVHKNIFIKEQSLINKAFSTDQINDAWITLMVLISGVIDEFFHVQLDHILGILVALYILYSGISIMIEASKKVVGVTLNETTMRSIQQLVLRHSEFLGSHSYLFHDYGPTNQIVSFHIEVSEHTSIVEAHDAIDEIEQEILQVFGFFCTIHVDPIMMNHKDADSIIQSIKDGLKASSYGDAILQIKPIRSQNHQEIVLLLESSKDIDSIQHILEPQFPSYRFVFEIKAP